MNLLASSLAVVTSFTSPLSNIEFNMLALTPKEVETKLDSIILFTPSDEEGLPMSFEFDVDGNKKNIYFAAFSPSAINFLNDKVISQSKDKEVKYTYTPKSLSKFSSLIEIEKSKSKKEIALLKQYARKKLNMKSINPWDIAYIAEKYKEENPQFRYYSSVTETKHYLPHQGEITFEIFNKHRLDKKQPLEIFSYNSLVKNKDGKILKYSYFFLTEQNDIEFRTTLSDDISLRGFLSPQIINTQVKKKGSLEDEYIFSPGGVGRCEIIEEPSIKNLPSDYEPESGLKIFE